MSKLNIDKSFQTTRKCFQNIVVINTTFYLNYRLTCLGIPQLVDIAFQILAAYAGNKKATHESVLSVFFQSYCLFLKRRIDIIRWSGTKYSLIQNIFTPKFVNMLSVRYPAHWKVGIS